MAKFYLGLRDATLTATSGDTTFPLSVSSNSRYLQTTGATPFFIQGDTAWSMMTQLSNAEIITYMDDRVARGFNAVIVELIESYFSDNPPNDVLGNAPFSPAGNFDAPQDAYFNRFRDSIMAPALTRGLLMIVNPCYLGFGGGLEGWQAQMMAESVATIQAYGAYLGTKYAAYPNIMWSLGGDWYETAVLTRIRALQAGLASTGHSGWTYTYHSGGSGVSSHDSVPSETWLDFNWGYAAYSVDDVVAEMQSCYAFSPTIPMALLEGTYEQERSVTNPVAFRAQAYWSVLCGGCGHVFGNNPIWHFESPRTIFAYSGTWQTNLASQGAQDMTRFGTFFRALSWQDLVPDTSNLTMTAGHQTGTSRAVCARSSDGALVLVYMPSSRAVTINMARLSGPSVLARWFNPSTGAYTTINTYANSGSQSFTPSSGDWVLLLESTTSGSLAWDAVTGATSYIIYWGTTSGTYTNSQNVGNVTTYSIASLGFSSGTTYYVQIRSYDGTNESTPWGEIVVLNGVQIG